MSLNCFLNAVSGLGLFLFGMNYLTESLKSFAETQVQDILRKATDVPFKSVIIGFLVTGIIQSSSATTLMCMGLTQSGIFSPVQALPVILGANIGSTVTAQILSLADLSERFVFLSFLKPSFIAPFFLLSGACDLIFFKNKNIRQCGQLFVGLGLLFSGITLTEASLSTVAKNEAFLKMTDFLNNPIAGVLSGILMTSIIQSSSVSIGILQSVSGTGILSLKLAFFPIVGMNIGKCIPELLASFTMKKDVRRLILADLLSNLSGAMIFSAVYIIADSIIRSEVLSLSVTKSSVAILHTLFNVVTVISTLPFYNKILRLCNTIIR